MIRIGTGGIPISAEERTTFGGLKRIKELELNALEIEFVRNVYLKNEVAKKVGEEAKKLDIGLSIHAPYFINLCSEKEKLEASKKRILDSVERAFYMNARVVVFHPGYYGKLSKDEAYEKVKEACKDLIEKMEKNGWNKVFLGLETTGKLSQFGTLEENIKISKEVKGCMPVIDFAHIFARLGGKIDFKEIIEKVSSLKRNFLHCHFSGIEFKLTKEGGNEKKHLNLTEGAKPDYKPLIKELKKVKFDITFISESPNLEGDALFLREMLKKEKLL
jgi:deoxyribonuclease-4